MNEPEADDLRPWARVVGAVLWPSFFAAGVATSVCFALVDPLALRDISFPTLQISRELGYSLGFFVFWLLCTSASSFTALLLWPQIQRTVMQTKEP